MTGTRKQSAGAPAEQSTLHCPSPTQIQGLVQGDLAPESRDQVQAHLGDCSVCRRLVSALASTTTGSPARRLSMSPVGGKSNARPNEGLADRYEYLEVIGRGGMGLVIKARHRTLDREVAVKLLDEQLVLNEEAARRFLREARAAARLESEHICQVLDADLLPDGQPFIALELLRGRDLAQELHARGALPVDETAHLIVQACLGLAVAHANQIVHRDIKPPNLFLAERSDGSRVLKVLDFGIAKVLESATLDGPETPQGALLGTPRYMAPEQLRASESVDARADVWALGTVLFEVLTGTAAFEGTTVHEVLSSVLVSAPRPIHSIRTELPAALWPVVERALRKDPNSRWPSVADLAEHLAPFGTDETRLLVKRVRRALEGGGRRASAPPSAFEQAPTTPAATSVPLEITPPPTTPDAPVTAQPAGGLRWVMLGLGALVALGAASFLIAEQKTEVDPEPTGASSPPAAAPEPTPTDEDAAVKVTARPEPSERTTPTVTATAGSRPVALPLPPSSAPATAPPPAPAAPPSASSPAPSPPKPPADLLNNDAMLDRK